MLVVRVLEPGPAPSASAAAAAPASQHAMAALSRCLLLFLLLLALPCSSDGAKRAKGKAKGKTEGSGSGQGLSQREAAACAEVQFMLGSVSCERFLAEHWETKPLLTRGTSAAVEPLFRSADLPRLLRYWPMKVNAEHGQVIFIRPDTFVHDDRYAHGSAVTPAVVNDAMRSGDTVLVHNLEIYWKTVSIFSEALSAFTNLYVQVNMYYSPHGFPGTVCAHQDAQSVFIMQLEGTKTWDLYAPKYQLALKKQLRGKAGDVVRRDEMGDHLLRTTLEPGDILFVPRGVFHSTSTENGTEPSLHLTIGMETDSDELTWGHWLADAIADVSHEMPMWGEESDLREALPLPLLRAGVDTRQGKRKVSAAHRTRAVKSVKQMLRTLSEIDDDVWHDALQHRIAARVTHLESKRGQLLSFRDHFDKNFQEP